MKIQCNNCGNLKTVNKSFIVDLFGLGMPAVGAYAWVTFLFAGTGFALPLCAAIVAGGPLLLKYKNTILESIVNRGYSCNLCGGKNWAAVSNSTKQIFNKPTNNKVISKVDNLNTQESIKDLENKENIIKNSVKKSKKSSTSSFFNSLSPEVREKLDKALEAHKMLQEITSCKEQKMITRKNKERVNKIFKENLIDHVNKVNCK